MQKHEIFTSQEGLDLMDFVNFQVEQGISLARSKGHKYYAYSLEFKIDEATGKYKKEEIDLKLLG